MAIQIHALRPDALTVPLPPTVRPPFHSACWVDADEFAETPARRAPQFAIHGETAVVPGTGLTAKSRA
jgi:hypothetical protein